jgi:trk system potassium uptake protein TrkH
MIYLMFIGASPGSCGGGIKTSTFATLLGALISKTKGRDSLEIFKRTIPDDMVNKALLIIVISLMLLATFSLILTSLQPDEPLKVIFELVSAFGTVGLSAGLTPKLSDVSKLVVIIMMFVGRIGPLTLALAIKHGERVNYKYPSERIMIG